ncbi:MAG: TRAP transporter small permease subunit [Alphaproteobacteria bacterium]|nr:TRAP transporter small permease subunit [Alphaproteobacteria bacterium]
MQTLSRFAAWIGGAGLLISAIMVTADVLSRKFLGVTMSGSDEYTGYVFAAATTWAYSYCVMHRSNVRIDALYNLMPMSVRAVLDIVGLVLLLIFMSVLLLQSWEVFATSWRQDSVSVTTLATPLWIPQLAWVSGLIMLEITLIFAIVHASAALFTGDIAKVQALAGTMSVQDEIREGTRGMGID